MVSLQRWTAAFCEKQVLLTSLQDVTTESKYY
jgi:hypothetical protein